MSNINPCTLRTNLKKENWVITMNKMAKIISVVLSVALVIGVTVAMLVSAFAASTPKFSLNLVEETKSTVTISINLESGSFNNVDFQVNAKDWNSGNKTTGLTLTEINFGQAYKDFQQTTGSSDPIMPMTNISNGKVSVISIRAYDEVGAMFLFTFSKASDKDVSPSDFFVDGVEAVNKIPAPVVPTKPTTEPTKPTTEPTKPTTEPTKPTTEPTKPTTEPTKPTTEPTKPTTEPTKPTTEPTKPTTEPTKPTTEPTEPSTDPTEPTSVDPTEPTSKVDDVTTTTKAADDTTKADDVVTTAPADDTTTAAGSTDTVANPETGDRLTATAAVVSLLAISGAAVVALRKKED